MDDSQFSHHQSAHPISRRKFIRLAATAALLAGCAPVARTAAPTDTPSPLPTATPAFPTATSVPPTATAIPPTATSVPPTEVGTPLPPTMTPFPGRPAVMKMYPDAPSRVVYTTHAGVWSGDTLVPSALRQMLDASITRLTGLNDARQAWAALFKPSERIAIKVNAFRNSILWTHVGLVNAVVASLRDAGIPGKQIIIYDANSDEIKTAGFTLAGNDQDVQYRGTDRDYTVEYQIASSKIKLSDILQNCDAIINMPLLKFHDMAGISFALKNHYGSVMFPNLLHNSIAAKMAALNALSPIRERTRLVIGDILIANLKLQYTWPYWRDAVKAHSILMSYDPVAHDTVGLDIFEKLATANQLDRSTSKELCQSCLDASAKLGLGTNDPTKMDLVKVRLS